MRLGLVLAFLSFCGAENGLAGAVVTLNWQDNSNNESGFTIERQIGAGSFVQLADVAANATAYQDTSAVGGTTYGYRVRAFNAGGVSAFSNVATITVPSPPAPPNLPPSGATAVIPGTLANVSNRGLITVGDASMIPGFVVTGGPLRVLIRVVGPTIGAAPFNVPDACNDPALSLRNSVGTQIAANNDWLAADATVMAQVGAFALPTNSKDAALVITLQPGNYTVVTSGPTGVAVAEVYAISP